ncbi:hypothetical protein ACQ4PT_052691 [Festuca glaucescens]
MSGSTVVLTGASMAVLVVLSVATRHLPSFLCSNRRRGGGASSTTRSSDVAEVGGRCAAGIDEAVLAVCQRRCTPQRRPARRRARSVRCAWRGGHELLRLPRCRHAFH